MTEQPWVKVNQYDAIRASEYKGRYAVQKARRTEKGNYVEWTNPVRYDSEAKESRPAIKKDGSPLLIPLQVPLGDDIQSAGNILRALYFQVTGEVINDHREAEPPLPPLPPRIEDDNLPF